MSSRLTDWSKKVPSTCRDFDFFPQKSGCYVVGFWFFFQKKVAPTWWDFLGSKKVPATWWDFDFFFPKNPWFWKIKLDFFPLKKVFEIFWRNTANYLYLNYLWPKFQHIWGIFFFTKYARFWKLKLDFFPIENVFRKKRLELKFFLFRS